MEDQLAGQAVKKIAHMPTLPRDVVFNVLYGADHKLMLRLISASVQRVAEYTQTCTVFRLAEVARHNVQHARCVFSVLMCIDEILREEICTGRFHVQQKHDEVQFEAMCPHKALSFFKTLRAHVLDPWIRNEVNTVEEFILAMRAEYLAA